MKNNIFAFLTAAAIVVAGIGVMNVFTGVNASVENQEKDAVELAKGSLAKGSLAKGSLLKGSLGIGAF